MDTIGDKLNSISETKANIKQAIQDMGVSDVGDTFATYPDKIREIINPGDYYTKDEIDSMMTEKADTNHASTDTTYGAGSTSNYGHVKLVTGDLNEKTEEDGLAASCSHTHSQYAPVDHASTDTTYGIGSTSNYGHVKLVTGNLNGKSAEDGCAASQAHTHSQYLLKSGDTMTGRLKMEDSSNIEFNPAENTEDCGNLTWNYNSGDEKMSIIAPNTPIYAQGPLFRVRDNNDTLLYSGNLALEQPGMITMWAGTTAPDGWLLCDGRKILVATATTATDYDFIYNGTKLLAVATSGLGVPTDRLRILAKIIQYKYGITQGGGPWGYINLPNFCGMFPVGAGTGSAKTGDTAMTFGLGEGGWNQNTNYSGEYYHKLTGEQSGLPDHTHNYTLLEYADTTISTSGSHRRLQDEPETTAATGSVNYSTTITKDAQEAHNNIPPYTAINFIIKY